MPLSVLNDSHCEELAHHPHLSLTGKFDYEVQRGPPFSS